MRNVLQRLPAAENLSISKRIRTEGRLVGAKQAPAAPAYQQGTFEDVLPRDVGRPDNHSRVGSPASSAATRLGGGAADDETHRTADDHADG